MGGIINAYGTNALIGRRRWMVVEADESDGTFSNCRPTAHRHQCRSRTSSTAFEAVQGRVLSFVENVPFYGFAVMCTDHPVVQHIVGKIEATAASSPTGEPQADARLTDLECSPAADRNSRFVFRTATAALPTRSRTARLPMPGRHNLNATAAIAVAHELGFSDDTIRKALASFAGVKRASPKPASGTASP